jgi:hypothetical protein
MRSSGRDGPRLIAALFSRLTPGRRLHASFCTGLRFSPCRPFRVFCLGDNAPENRRLARQHRLTLFEAPGLGAQVLRA